MVDLVIMASDDLIRAGALGYVEGRQDIRIRDESQLAEADVVAVVEERITSDLLGSLREQRGAAAGTDRPRCVVVTNEFPKAELVKAVGCGVYAILPLRDTQVGLRLVSVVLAVDSGNAYFPAHLQGEMLVQLERVHREVLAPHGVTMSGLTERERNVLALLADGYDTGEIATRLSCSERTVKNVLRGIMTRYDLKHRAHAVAFAVRSGAC